MRDSGSAVAVVLTFVVVTGYLVNVIVHLVGHFFELVVGHAEVSLVWVEMSVLPAALSLSLIHVRGQVERCLEGLRDGKDRTIPSLLEKNTNKYFIYSCTEKATVHRTGKFQTLVPLNGRLNKDAVASINAS